MPVGDCDGRVVFARSYVTSCFPPTVKGHDTDPKNVGDPRLCLPFSQKPVCQTKLSRDFFGAVSVAFSQLCSSSIQTEVPLPANGEGFTREQVRLKGAYFPPMA